MSGLLAWAWLFTLPGLVLTALGLPRGRRAAGWLSVPGPFVLLIVALATVVNLQPAQVVFPNWLPVLSDGAFRSYVDGLSAMMLVILGFVAALVYVYSLGYMADDPGRRRFFVYLDLFVATMTLLVLAGNLAVLLIGWTGVGVSSFLLISFWRDRPGTLNAGLQALAANAIGDGALLLAVALVPRGCGALAELGSPACTAGIGGAELLALLIFVAAAAKSAQGPLYFWLPSAMAGPTPISALIHAATMVAAGVYLLVRTHALIAAAPPVAFWIAVVGVATAVLASVGSLLQANFKRGIAYSTLAQLGYMFAAVGVGASFAAFFHLTTHAAFKALLFLAAGVVIHGLGGEELLARLSGRGRGFFWSRIGFLVGSLALMGIPFVTAGAFSKEAILGGALDSRMTWVGYVLLASVFLTGAYIGRLYFRVYHGPALKAEKPLAASHEPAEHHDPAAQRFMDWALIPLMIASIAAGYLAWPSAWLQHLLAPAVGETEVLNPFNPMGFVAMGLGIVGFAIAGWLQMRPAREPVSIEAATPVAAPWVSATANGGYVVARWFANVQSGRLPLYALGSVGALAILLIARVMIG